MNPDNDIDELEGPFEQIAGAVNTVLSDGSAVPTLEVYFKDKKVTGETKDVWVGQLISLVAKTDPAGQNIEEPVWTVPDKVVGGYKAKVSEGKVEKFDTKSLKNSSVKFYWVNSGSKEVKFKGKVSGAVKEVTVTFNVKTPDVSMVVDTNSEPTLKPDPDNNNSMMLEKAVVWDRHGQTQEGEIVWVQLGEVSATVLNDTVIYSQGPGFQSDASGLDRPEFPYPSNPTLADTPILSVDRKVALNMWRSDVFRDWIMFKHKDDGSIWVPLKKVEWYWMGSASRVGISGDWTLDSFDYEKNPKAKDTDEFPTWDSFIPSPLVFTPLGQ